MKYTHSNKIKHPDVIKLETRLGATDSRRFDYLTQKLRAIQRIETGTVEHTYVQAIHTTYMTDQINNRCNRKSMQLLQSTGGGG